MITGIFIAAPEGHQWALRIEEFESALQQRFPDVRTATRHSPVTGNRALDFDVEINGEDVWGSYVDRTNLVLAEGEPSLWAESVTWFLSLLPDDASAVAMVEANPDEVAPVRRDANADSITLLLESLCERA
ncbi:hypothetical protein [Streptomyces sp. NPDC014733]|uniref:hypothetical protein n=1 Tax=Streptomyces sp. NPDC014733 TaxID=3364885 RepID=UPI0036FF4BF3